MNSMEQGRLKYIDWVKAIGICAIIFAHCEMWFPVMGGCVRWVMGFHVPLFFMVAGCLESTFTRKEKIKEYIIKKAKALLIPYAIFSIINSGLKLGVIYFTCGQITSEVLKVEISELLITGNGTVWFLTTFFFMEIIVLFMRKKYNRIIWIGTMILGIAIPYIVEQPASSFIVLAVRIVGACGYYSSGVLLKTLLMDKIDNRKFARYLGLICFIVGSLISLIVGTKFEFFTGIFEKPLSSIAVSILCCMGIILVLYAMDHNKYSLLCWIGKNSLCLMLVHPIFMNCFTYPFSSMFSAYDAGIISVLVALSFFFAIMMVSIFATVFVNRYCPWILGKRRV